MKIILPFLLFFFSCSVCAQYFSGEIQYETEIIPKNKDVNVDSLWALKQGKTKTYLISDSFYKSTFYTNGKATYAYFYDNISKRMYDDYAERDYITYRDSRKANYEYYGSQIYRDSTEIILGLDCFMVKSESDYGKTRTFYSDEIRVNAASFEDHKVGNWHEKLKEVNGSLPIKTITEFEKHIEIQKAVKITPLELDQHDFEVPGEKIIVAAYTALDKRVELRQPSRTQLDRYQTLIREGVKDISLDKDNYKSYVGFVVTRKGELQFIEALEQDPHGLYKIAERAIRECGFEFIPGKIDGRKVSSLAYFPVEFKK